MEHQRAMLLLKIKCGVHVASAAALTSVLFVGALYPISTFAFCFGHRLRIIRDRVPSRIEDKRHDSSSKIAVEPGSNVRHSDMAGCLQVTIVI